MFRYTIKELEENSDERMISLVMHERRQKCTNINSPLYVRLSRIYGRFGGMADNGENVISLKFVEETLQNNSSLKGDEISKIVRTLKAGIENPKIRC